MRQINIITIAGTGRSGSTILSLLLTQHPSVFNLGQLRDLWKSYDRDQPCSCGSKLSACPVYSPVIPALFGEDTSQGLSEMKQLMRAFFKEAASHADWSNADTVDQLRQNHRDFLSKLGKVIQALQSRTGIHNFVDTSKSPEMALAFSLACGIRVRVVNLVRDPRAVACSWRKKKKSVKFSSRDWVRRQRILKHWGPQLGERFLQLRYEHFSSRPQDTIERILQWAGFPQAEGLFTKPNHATISWEEQHLFAPANESVLGERKTDVIIAPAEAWRAARNFPVHLMTLLYSYPDGLRFIRSQPEEPSASK